VKLHHRSVLLGDALRVFGGQRTPQGRRRIINRAQTPFAVILTVMLTLVLTDGTPENSLSWIVGSWAFVVAVTAAAYVVPWERHPEATGVILGAVDMTATAVITAAVAPLYPTIVAIQLLPALILAFSFGVVGTVVAVAGTFLTAFLPAASELARNTPHDIVEILIVPVMVTIVAVVTQFASRMLLRVQREYENVARVSENEQAVTMTVLNSLDVGTAFVRLDSSVGFTNTAFRALVERAGMDDETQAGTRVFAEDRVTPIPPEDQMMAQAARGEFFDSRLYVVGEPGNQITYLVTARPVVRADGERIGAAFVSKDVTELTDSLRVRDEFLSVVSHELRTPLTSIVGYLEIIEDDIDAEALGIAGYIDTVNRNVQQLQVRIADLLHVADPSLELHTTLVDVPALLQTSIDDIRPRATSASVDVVLAPHEPVTAVLDEPRMQQVMGNLLTNAVKYSRPDGEVRVEIAATPDQIEIAVADEGTGIADHELKHVFDRFYRTESARDAVIQGTGLGLAIVRDIVDAHGGEVVAESTVGVGSTFTVRLPLHAGV
jgi:signal transduction histidine kinase